MTIYKHRTYLEKHRFYPRFISLPPSPDLGICVVIPCHSEDALLETLTSLASTSPPSCQVEVIIVLNASLTDHTTIHEINDKSKAEFEYWNSTYRGPYTFHLLDCPDLPPKHAGVGLARKIGMDEAVDRFGQISHPDGIIVCLDADCTTAPNYLIAIEAHFRAYPHTAACTIHFEHPIQGTTYSPDIYAGIVRYELFLRYYIQGLRISGYPFAFHTVGSSMAVRAQAYQSQGGMNKRKAGEDFYFLHKFTVLSKLSELFHTCVYPSPRPSERVPFGTGKSIIKWLGKEDSSFLSYHPQVFQDLQKLFSIAEAFYYPETVNWSDLPEPLRAFLAQNQAKDRWTEMLHHVSNQENFVKRWWKWWDGLKVLKYVHFAMDQFYEEKDIVEAAEILLYSSDASPKISPTLNNFHNPTEKAIFLLKLFRKWQNPHYALKK